MKLLITGTIVLGLAVASQAAVYPILVDDFGGDLSAYTETRILDTQGAGDPDDVYFSISGGQLYSTMTASDGDIEQTMLLRDDYSLGIGQELTVDLFRTDTLDRDIGIAVATAANIAPDQRSDYLMIFLRGGSSQIGSSGFNGTTDVGLAQAFGTSATRLFIERTGANDWDLGYYEGAARTVLASRTMSNSSIGNAIGFYSDQRTAGTMGGVDNLQIIPEPATIGLVGIFGAGMLIARRRFRI